MKGVFITFEGGEAVGKSTQIALLEKALKKLGHRVFITREPGGTKLGEMLRRIIKSQPMSDRAELLLFEASRAQLVETLLLPKLREGFVILCDRYAESSLVYQGMTRGLPLDEVRSANQIATGGLKSDFIILLDGAAARERLKRRKKLDRIELEKDAFHRKISKSYHALSKKDSRFHFYPADLDRQLIHKMILKDVMQIIQRKLRR